jgi:RNA-directed DNA polymerase
VGFEHRAEAERFLSEFPERLAKFGLEINTEKTRLIELGRFARRDRQSGAREKRGASRFWG